MAACRAFFTQAVTSCRLLDIGSGTILPLRLPDFPSIVSLHATNPGVYFDIDPATLQTRECKFADALEIDHSTKPRMDPDGTSCYGARAGAPLASRDQMNSFELKRPFPVSLPDSRVAPFFFDVSLGVYLIAAAFTRGALA